VSASDVAVEWRGAFESAEVEGLHAEGFGHEVAAYDWLGQVERHSLGWVTARRGGQLIGWVNVAWDGAGHAFILDTLVAGNARGQGIATRLVTVATDHARASGCEWLHVDFDAELEHFYFDACGFTSTPAGVISL
jgi:GNAT superfamily N-acetyltransferase